MTRPEPVLTERGEKAKALLSAPGMATPAEMLALAVLEGRIAPPSESAGYDNR
jgi:hypothetical protein